MTTTQETKTATMIDFLTIKTNKMARKINKLGDVYLPKEQTPLEKLVVMTAAAEGGKVQVSVGNIRSVLKEANKILGGVIYAGAKAKFSK